MNIDLIAFFVLYFLSLFFGFSLYSKNKDKQNKQYNKFKWVLHFLIALISIYTLILFFSVATQGITFMYWVVGIQLLFLIYFYSFVFKSTRCWKQHRMLLYHFLLLPFVYFSSLVYGTNEVLWIGIFIYIYNILEFQFAKFSFKQMRIWD